MSWRGDINLAELPKITVFGLFSVLGMTVALGIYCARPWGSNHAYQDLSGYLVLCGLMAWAISPYIAMLTTMWLVRKHPRILTGLSIGASAIAVLGFGLLFDAVSIHRDPQSGLAFLFVPVYQWIATLALSTACLAVCLGTRRLVR